MKEAAPGTPKTVQAAASPHTELLGILSRDDFEHEALSLAEQSAGVGVWSIDLATGLLRATPQFFRILGLEPTAEAIPLDLIRAMRHPEDRERVVAGFRQALEGGSDVYEIEYRILRPDGEVRWIFGRGRVVRDSVGKPKRYSGIDLDVTGRKIAEAALADAKQELERMNQVLELRVRERTAELEGEATRRLVAEARLHQAQKMEAVGQLTGGIAHDFNNILQVIVGSLEIASRTVSRAQPFAQPVVAQRIASALETAQKASQSASQLIQRLLAFGRLQTLQPTIINVNSLVDDMTEMLRRSLGEMVTLKTVLSPELNSVCADRNQLESALLNLVVNARDAMANGGQLTIETANVSLDATNADDISPGRYVALSVSDTGCGIAKESLGRIFEPFFTTKEIGKGSGLGLSMVYGFVTQSDGYVRVYSEEGLGTTVRLYLPQLATGVAASDGLGDVGLGRDESLPQAIGGETILLVEDNEAVRTLAATSLTSLGYRVLQASDSASAFEIIDGLGNSKLDLLFTDVVLPGGMDGSKLVATVHTRFPTMPALFATGYAQNAFAGTERVGSERMVLNKPYSLERLARAVRDAIDGTADTSERLSQRESSS